MNINEVMDQINTNFDAINEGLNRMDLDLLPELMRTRSGLTSTLATVIEDSDRDVSAVRNAVYSVKQQNFQLESRITNFLYRAKDGLEDVALLEKLNSAYGEEKKREKVGQMPPASEYC